MKKIYAYYNLKLSIYIIIILSKVELFSLILFMNNVII